MVGRGVPTKNRVRHSTPDNDKLQLCHPSPATVVARRRALSTAAEYCRVQPSAADHRRILPGAAEAVPSCV